MPSLIEAPGLRACFDIAAALKLSFIELNMNMPEYLPDRFDADLARRLISETGIYLTLHLPEDLNPAHFSTPVREAYVQTALSTLRIARDLGMPIVNMHMADGIFFTLPDKKVFLFDVYKNDYLTALKSFRDACAKEIGNSDVTVMVENCGGFHAFQQAGIDVLLESPAFSLTLDVGHDHAAKGVDMPFVSARQNRLRHMHLHDALGTANHLALGDGEVDIKSKLALAKEHDCSVVVEVKTLEALKRSVATLR